MNNGNNQSGKNARAMREYFDESQDDVAKIYNVARNTYNKYETGANKTGIPDDIKEKIAKRYFITIDELMSADLSSYNPKFSKRNTISAMKAIDEYYPILGATDDKALGNSPFSEAFNQHIEIYYAFKSININGVESLKEWVKSIFTHIQKLSLCLDNYCEAYKNDAIKEYAASNFIALYHLSSSLSNIIPALPDKPAFLNPKFINSKIMPIDEEYIEKLASISKEDTSKVQEFFITGIFNSKKYNASLDEMMITLHLWKNDEYSGLDSYYDALEFVNNIVDNNDDYTTNLRNGYKMLKQIAKYGNRFAKQYLKYNPDIIE